MSARPSPVLKRFAMRVLKGSPVVPAAGATVEFYRQGATVKEAASSFASPVVVYHTGTLAPGDVVQVGADPGKTLSVDAVDADAAALELSILTGGSFGLSVGERLVRIKKSADPDPVADPARIYEDPLGTAGGVGARTVPADGWVRGYVREYRYDIVVSGDGFTAWVYPDADGSWVSR